MWNGVEGNFTLDTQNKQWEKDGCFFFSITLYIQLGCKWRFITKNIWKKITQHAIIDKKI